MQGLFEKLVYKGLGMRLAVTYMYMQLCQGIMVRRPRHYEHLLLVQGDFEFEDTNNHYGYIAYLAVLVIWEVIPTYLIVIFFRVRMPSSSVVSYKYPER